MYPFFALLVSGVFMLLWGAIMRNTGNFASLIIVKIIPAILGIWCLWEAAIIYISNN
jgi:hypothetical protein